jgi:hypothetical protein
LSQLSRNRKVCIRSVRLDSELYKASRQCTEALQSHVSFMFSMYDSMSFFLLNTVTILHIVTFFSWLHVTGPLYILMFISPYIVIVRISTYARFQLPWFPQQRAGNHLVFESDESTSAHVHQILSHPKAT